jgi:trimeric autotransporter adhesin
LKPFTHQFTHTLRLGLLGVSLGLLSNTSLAMSQCAAGETSALFGYTGAVQTQIVPANVSTIAKVFITGGQGGSGTTGLSAGGSGGLGASVTGNLTVTPGETLNIYVGGQANQAVNGGGVGGTLSGGIGGGASDIRQGGNAVANRVAIAGGGGGGGSTGCPEDGAGPTVGVGGNGGGGGGIAGTSGTDSAQANGVAGGGAGGAVGVGGAAGIGCGGFLGGVGQASGNGGAGQSCCCSSAPQIPSGGGGGGGAVVGGGGGGGSAGTTACQGNSKGAGGGGAGGTSANYTLTSPVLTPSVQMGNGMVEVCFVPSYVITTAASPLAGGSISCPANSSGAAVSCTATPNAGYRTLSISGCNGTATAAGINSYSTGTIAAACTVTANFQPIVNGSCGSANGVASIAAPASNLCGAPDTASAVTSMTNTHNWTCASNSGGTTASCTAPRQYTVTANPGANGGLTCTSPVNGGATSTCNATPAMGYRTLSISGCGGTTTGAGVNAFTTGNVSANCTVASTYELIVNGSCGSANGVAVFAAPSTNLCGAPDTPSIVTSSATTHNWTCASNSGGTTASCAAPRVITNMSGMTVPSAGGPLAASASFTTSNGGASCSFDPANTAFVAAPAVYPLPYSITSMPHGAFKLRLINCTPGFTARVSVTWPSLTTLYTKYGKTPSSPMVDRFYQPTNLSLSGNVASFDVTDGGLGDDDLAANGVIIDPNGPVLVLAGEQPPTVPTLSEGLLLLLALSLLGWAALRFRQRQ